MFNKGEKIVYGQTGVCVIEDIAEKELIKRVKKLYYKLKPVYQPNNVIYAPVNSDKVFMRAVITKEKAQELINKIPEIYQKALTSPENAEETADCDSFSCERLAQTAVKIHLKKRAAKNARKRLGFTEEKKLEQAEELLFGEFAQVFELDINEVPNLLFAAIKEQTGE